MSKMSNNGIHERSDAGLPNPRRRFLNRLSLAFSAAAAAAIAIPSIGFLLGPVIRRTPQVWRRVGRTDEVPVGRVTEVAFTDASPLPWAGVTARTAAWLFRPSADEVIA